MYQAWFQQLCQTLPQLQYAVLLETAAPASADERLLASWPEGAAPEAGLLARARTELAGGVGAKSGKTAKGSKNGNPLVLVRRLPGGGDALQRMLALQLDVPARQRHSVNQLLDWSEHWLRLLLDGKTAAVAGPEAPQAHLLQRLAQARSEGDIAHQLCLGLNNALDCERVAAGLQEGGDVQLVGVSSSPAFDAHAPLVRLLEAAMQDCLDSARPRLFQPDSDSLHDAHYRLSAQLGGRALYSIPLPAPGGDGRLLGAVVFVLPAATCVADSFIARVETWMPVMQALLRLQPRRPKRRLGRWRERLVDLFTRRDTPRSRIVLTLLTLVAIWLCLGKMEYRVSADAQLEGRVQRAVVAPFDGYIASSSVRAGEEVSQGQLLARLDDRELQLQLSKLQNQYQEYAKQYRQALAQLDRAQSQIVQAQMAQVEAELALLQQQLQRARLQAPLSGVVIRGDLHRALGAPVEKGEVLFELAPLREYRLVLTVDERDIAAVREGQRGSLLLTALPGKSIPFTVESIAAAEADASGTTLYRTEARLETDVASLRPGMQGLGKIEVGPRRILWVGLHDLLDWWRLRVWLWMP